MDSEETTMFMTKRNNFAFAVKNAVSSHHLILQNAALM